MADEHLQDLIAQRAEKLHALAEKDLNPFHYTEYRRTHLANEILDNFDTMDGQTVRIAGRVMTRRGQGKVTFADVRDRSGKIQAFFRFDDLGEERYQRLKQFVDVGDILGIEGYVFKTRMGEVSVHVTDFVILSKSLRPLPDKWHGLKDVEVRYRQRYVDLIVSPEVRDTFIMRSRTVKAIRRLLDEKDFLEVETPMMQQIPGGAAARPFITHHNALGVDLYLRIAPELYLKRLIVGGMERVYEINRNFRNEGIDTKHNPEFTMLEVYEAYANYEDMMRLSEEIFSAAAMETLGTLQLTYQGQAIDLTPPWKRISMFDALREFGNVDTSKLMDFDSAKELCRTLGVHVDARATLSTLVNNLFEAFVEPNIVQPTFITDHPTAISPLAKRRRDNPELTERFEIFIAGRELGNAFSELNDPIDQRGRFEQQVRDKTAGDDEAHPMDEDYLRALEYGMPPTGGLGIGIDRLVMLLADAASIRDVILFPQLKPQNPGETEEEETD
ncbi:MAG TPA: lysine--tRNA ligase [Armatimonadota bacterium]